MADALPLAEVDRMAALAHLALTDEERVLFAGQLAAILEYAQQVRTVDTEGVPPTSHTLTPETVLRDDRPTTSLPREVALENAPDAPAGSGLFRVPRVIGG